MEERFKVALESVVRRLEADPEVRVVQLFGSVHRGTPHAGSDIDMYVLTSRNSFRRIAELHNGVCMEAILGPVKDFQRVLLSRDLMAVQSFAHGSTLLDRDGVAPELVALARRLDKEGPVSMKPRVQVQTQALLARALQKLERLPPESAEARMIASEAVRTVIHAFFLYHRIWLRNLASRLPAIEEKDPHLGKLLITYYAEGQTPEQARAIVSVMLEQLGGPLIEYVSEEVAWSARPGPAAEGEAG